MKWHKKPFSRVSISHVDDRDLKAVLTENLNNIGGMSRFVKPGQSVFIKPNLTAGAPAESGGTTRVDFVEAIVELVKEAGAGHIIVGECSGNESRSIESLTNLGYADMCARQQVEMADLDHAQFDEIKIDDPVYQDTVRLPKIFMQADVFISVPVLKNHISVGVTMAMKNSFGLIPDDDKLMAHRNQGVEKILVDINRVRPADLICIDARLGLEGIAGGTDFEKPIVANLMYVGDDPVAMDIVGTHLMMQNPRVKYLQWAAERGVGNDNLDYIVMEGLSIEEAQLKFQSPAEQVMEDSNHKVRIHELNPCTLCRAMAEGGVSRYSKSPNSLLAPVDIVVGPGKWHDMPKEINERTIFLGDCMRDEYKCLGTFIGGCPIDQGAYTNALAEMNIVCAACEERVNEAILKYSRDELADIRILASNKTVFKGKNNNAMMDDFMLAVGNCQRGYVRNHKRRSHKLSDLDLDPFIVTVEGCCPGPSVEEIDAGIQELLARAKAKK